jgi:ABC-type sugar transport system ATPase subunit
MTAPPLLEMRGIAKRFGGVEALKSVDLDLRRGEIVGLVGDNGAGKSTLMKVLAGVHTPDAGEILIDGKPVQIGNINDARRAGIEMVYQDLALFDEGDVAWNIFAGRERRSPRFRPQLSRRTMAAETRRIIDRLGMTALPNQLVGVLSGGQRQMVAIARSIVFSTDERIIIMDEPTAALGVTEEAAVDAVIRRLGDEGLSIIYISHRIPQLLAMASRIHVLKGGHSVGVVESANCSVEQIVSLIVAGEPVSAGQRTQNRRTTLPE